MENAGYLLAAFGAVWVVLFGYLLSLMMKQKKLQQEVDSLKQVLKEKKGST